MKAEKASTPGSRDNDKGLVPQGRENCGKDTPEAVSPGLPPLLVHMNR